MLAPEGWRSRRGRWPSRDGGGSQWEAVSLDGAEEAADNSRAAGSEHSEAEG
jgi:hypothetical protein